MGAKSISPANPALIAQVAAGIVAAGPDAVFYGGATQSGAGLLKAELVKRGYTGPFVGGDGIEGDPAFVEQAGVDAASNTFASLAAPDLSTFTSGAAAQFVRDYHARYPGQYLDGYDAKAFDAAMVLITAIKHLIGAGRGVTRAALLEQVQHIKYAGVTGPINFDSYGDITQGIFSIYEVQDGMWFYQKEASA